ncbi:MAG: motility protein A [Bdellovibrionales bacterium]
MNDTPETNQQDSGPLPNIKIEAPRTVIDLATVLGLLFAFGFIAGAILLGESNANFFQVQSLMIVLFGSMAATAISFTTDEIAKSLSILTQSVFRPVRDAKKLSLALVDLAVVAKKRGVLALSNYESQLKKDPFLSKAMQMVIDGYNPEDIEPLLVNEVEVLAERHKRSASIARRASEIAPAMGLIGTLVGLVQMLADLENPDAIGPAMALALLTTFYGAILGTIVMSPIAVKLEKNSTDETLIKSLITIAAASIAAQDNPRRLEMQLNSELPPAERIRYFD